MLFALACLLAMLANALGRRIAGGLVRGIGGTQGARAIQAAIAGATVAALLVAYPVGPLWWAAAVVPLTFAGATAGFPRGMLPRNALDHLGILAHGLMAVAPLALAAWWMGLDWWFLIAAGIMRVPCYGLAPLWTPHLPALGLINLRAKGGPIDPPPFAELLSGAALGLGLVLAVRGV